MTQVGNYRITEQIGSGSFGQVFLGYHKFLRVKVCLKRGSRDPNDIQTSDNTMREFYYLKQFDHHPHITKLYEVIFTDKYVYLALHYYAEGDLFNYLAKRGKIPIDESLKIFVQLVGAVYYMHKNGCCHRDLKLENVLLDHKLNVKLSDFGFTREIPLVNKNTNKGRCGKAFLTEICGTEAYMAPELEKRIPYSGVKIDIWALGVILYTIVTGHMPFDDNLSSAELKNAIINREPDYDDTSFNGISDVVGLLKSLLAKAPGDRPRSLSDVLDLPFLKPYGSQNQLDVVSKLMDKDFGDSGVHYRITGSDKALFKEMVRMGIDKECLRRSVEYDTLDSLDGFWKLLREKRRYKAEKKKHRNHHNSVLLLTGSKDLLGSIQKKKGKDKVKTKIIPEHEKLNKEKNGKLMASPVLGSRANFAADEGNPQEASLNSESESSGLLASSKANTLERSRTSFSLTSLKNSRWFESLLDHLSLDKQKKNSISRSKTTESNNKESLLHRFFTSASTGRSIATLNNAGELEHPSSNSGASDQTENDKVAPLRSEMSPSPLSMPKMHGMHNSVAGSGHNSAFNFRTTSPSVMGSRQASIARSLRPSSVISAYSIQTTLSETSNGSGYTTGYSTDNRPGITRGLSDMSVGSRDVSVSHPGSPNSSIIGISRATSIDSSSKSSAGQTRMKNSPRIVGGGSVMAHHGRKSALKTKINAKWNFGMPSTNGSLKRLRRHAPKQIIEEEEEEDNDNMGEENDANVDEDVNDEINGDSNRGRPKEESGLNIVHDNISDNERALTEDDSVIFNGRLQRADNLSGSPYKFVHSKKNEYEDGDMADNEGDDNSNFDGTRTELSYNGLSKMLPESRQAENKEKDFSNNQIPAESTVIEDETSDDNHGLPTSKFSRNQVHQHHKRRIN